MNKEERGAIVGMILGDGCVRERKRYEALRASQTQVLFQCSHSIKQLEYCEFKAARLNKILGGKSKTIFYDVKLKGRESTPYKMCRFVKVNEEFRRLRDHLYTDGKKIITQRFMDWLSIEGLAYWYADDGCTDWWRRTDGSVTSCQSSLAVCQSVHQCDLVIEKLYGLGIDARIGQVNNQNYLRMRTEASNNLFSLIKPYLPNCMLYKVDPNYIVHECQTPGKVRVMR